MNAPRRLRLSRSRRGSRGFSLLELLVAFAIMAISLGVLYRAMGSSVRNVGDLDLRQQATLVAESALDRVSGVPPAGLALSGGVGGMDWSIQTRPFEAGSSDPAAPKLHEVQVVVSWSERGEPKQLVLQTLRPERGPRQPGG